ncbi:MAG: tetratricopeptide repeat protein [Steroidobacteraceae bacterium]
MDQGLDEISSSGQVVKLEPRTMRLLLHLAANAGRVVPMEELLGEIWPNVVVTPQSVYNTVAQLRRALGDVSETPTYITTIPRKGYRLIAAVEHRVPDSTAADGTKTTVPLTAGAVPAILAPAEPAPTDSLLPRSPARAILITGLAVGIVVSCGLALLVARGQGLRLPFLSPATAPASRSAVAEHSIAVLPFRDLSAAQDHAYLAEGLAEQIGTVLSRVPQLRVAARASAFASRNDDIPAIARKLNVDHVLEGSVQTAGDGLRITAQLIRTSTGQSLWSKTYDRSAGEEFSVEDEIASDVLRALAGRGLATRPVAQTCGRSGEANTLLLQGRYLGRRNTRADRDRSIDLYSRALALDPDCALAWAWLSTAYAVQAANGWVAADAGYERARDAAQRALRLDPGQADAHAALAYVYEYHDWHWADARAELTRALDLDSGDVRVLNMNGHMAMDLGRIGDAIAFYHRAVERDPLSPGALGGLAAALWNQGQLAEAEGVYRQAAALSPATYHTWAGLVLLDRGEPTAALAEVQQELDPALRLMGRAIVYEALRDRASSDAALAELVEKFPDRAYEIAQVHARRGDADGAFQWLERAFTGRDSGLLWLKVSMVLRPIRNDPRYEALLRRMGLPG